MTESVSSPIPEHVLAKKSTEELSEELCGLITWTHLVENYPGLGSVSGIEMMEKFIAHAKLFDIPLLEEQDVVEVRKGDSGFEIKTKKTVFRTKTVIFATGTTVKQLGVPGEERLKSKGVSYCATCDAAFFRNTQLLDRCASGK